MQWTESNAEKRLSELKMPDMPIMQIIPKTTPVESNWFQKYKELCHDFVRSLGDSVQELALMNLSRDEFMDLLTGRKIPGNISFRLKIPLVWGGKLDIDNMFMCFTFPQSHNLDRFILEQSGNEIIWVPNPSRKIYLPIHSTITGNGGNAVPDRLNQFAATVSTNRRQ
ncbi:MAG: hypothetical protein IJR92_03015 [Alphaproteobacteria bacterium]|nr:hypothetical protein [Alphaproteobacteria bacterium]